MRIKQTIIIGLSTLLVVPMIAVVAAPRAGALECSILPKDICSAADSNNKNAKPEDSAIWKLLILVLNILTAGVGIAAVGGIVYGAILYGSAGDKAEQTKKAKDIIFNVAIGLVAFMLMYGFLNFLIPGGIFT